MRRLRAWMLRLAATFSKERHDREFADELASHLQLHIDENLRAGMTPEQARRDAVLKLGGVEPTREAYRDRATLPLLENLKQDLRYALRQLQKNPGFAVTATLVLALGVCASVTLFGFVDAALIQSLPYRNPPRLAAVTEKVALFSRANLSYPDYLDWKRMNKVFQSLDVFTATGYLLGSPSGAVPLIAARVSDGFFRTLGVTPILGRDFYAGEDLPNAPLTTILSYATWQKRFGGERSVIGRTVRLSGVPYTVVGVLAKDFQFAPQGGAELWTTLHPAGSCDLRRSCHGLDGIARLKDGVSIETALADMTLIARQLEKEYPDSNRGQGASVMPLSEVIVGRVRPILLVLLGAAGLLLLIAYVNVASLLLVRSESRRREMAVRSSLGASRARLVRQFITEALVLVAAGGILGLLFAGWTIRLLLRLLPEKMLADTPFLNDAGLSLHVIAFAVGVAMLGAVIFALTPALRVQLSDMRAGLAEGGRGSSGTLWRRFGSNLVVVELAITVVLLVGAGLLGKSFYRLLHVEIGFQPDHLATTDVAALDSAYGKPAQSVALGREIVNRFTALPGVKSAALTSQLPVSYNGNTDWIRFVGRPYHGEHNEVNHRDVSSAYFATLQAKLLSGRYFTDNEDASKPRVVIINETLARKYYPGEDPVGKRIGDDALSPGSIAEIIGVVADVKDGELDSDTWPAVYFPINQSHDTFFSVVVRASQDEASLLPALRKTIHEIDPSLGTLNEATMDEFIRASPTAFMHRLAAGLVGGFAAVALLLSVVGLYGVIAYSVSRRTREIGLRMALGAERHAVYRLILKEAGWLAVLGIAAGLLCSVAAATLMRKLLFGTEAWDAATLAAVAVVLGIAALLASFFPARSAAAVNPLDALRVE